MYLERVMVQNISKKLVRFTKKDNVLKKEI